VYDVDAGEQESVRGIAGVGGGAIVAGFGGGHLGDAGREGRMITSEADAGSAGQREEVRLVRVRTGADESGDVGRDAPSVQRRSSFLLEEGDRGEDGVGEGRVEKANKCVGLLVRYWEGCAGPREEDEWIR